MKSRFCFLALAVLVGVLASPPALAQRSDATGALPASLGQSHFTMTGTTGMVPQRQYTYFKFNSDGYQISSIEVSIAYDDSNLNLAGVDTTHFGWNEAATFVVTTGTGYVDVKVQNIPPQVFSGSEELLKFSWDLECFTDGTNQSLTFENSGERINQFVTGGNSYTPTDTTNGYVGVYTYTGDVWGAADTVPVGHVAAVPLRITNSFGPTEGFYVKVFFNSSKLEYQGWDTVGCYDPYCAGGEALSVSANGNVITIASTCQYYKLTSPIDLIHLKFTNAMTSELDSAYVVVDSMKQTDCSDAFAVDAANDTAWVLTPKYEAWIKYKPTNIARNTPSAAIEIQIKQPFEVDMQKYEDTKRAAFRTDVSSWTILGYGSYSPVYTRADSVFKWDVLSTYENDRIYKSNYDGPTDNIPPSADYGTVMTQTVSTGSTTGYQVVWFDRDASGEDEYGTDSKLTSTFLDKTILSVDDANYDSLFYLQKDSVLVYWPGGGGGSCPFVYTWDGSDYALEDVVLTESERQPERTPVVDYLPLTFTPAAVDGSYRLRIHEQEAEKTLLDHVELITVDHAPGYDLSVTQEGRLSFGSGRTAPASAVDDQGRDVMDLVGDLDDRRIERVGSGYVVATFEGRPGVNYALSADDSTGQEGGDWKNPCKVWAGPQGQQPPELSRLRLEVEDARGDWHELPATPMRLPLARVRPVVDLSGYDLPGTFRIRYNWDERCNIDQLSLVQQVSVPHTSRRLPVKSVSHSGADPGSALVRRADGQYAELVTGEYFDLTFSAAPVPEGKERSFVLVTRGYYLAWYGHPEAGRPLEFGLNGNYPNPFNPSTTIRYSLAADGKVTLEIFNILGQKVRTLVDGRNLAAGAYEVFWNGNNEQGEPVGSGAYLYRLTAGDLTDTRRMILLK